MPRCMCCSRFCKLKKKIKFPQTVEGVQDFSTYQRLLQNWQRLRGHLLIYHIPGRRSCSTGEHLHLCNQNTGGTVFCHEKTCNFNTECRRLNKNGTFEIGAKEIIGQVIDGFKIQP
jgi:hypothetical protein